MNIRPFCPYHLIKKYEQGELSLNKHKKPLKITSYYEATTFLNLRYENQFLNSQFTILIQVTFTIPNSEFTF